MTALKASFIFGGILNLLLSVLFAIRYIPKVYAVAVILNNLLFTLKQFFLDIGFDKAKDNSEGKLIEFDYRTSIGGYTKK